MFIDSHAHLDMPLYDADRAEVIARAREAGVKTFLEIAGSDIAKGSLEVGLALAEQYPFVYAAVGVHPHEASLYDDALEQKLIEYSQREKVIGWGEIGLDYHYDHSPRDVQRRVFRRQLEVALERCLPVIIHTREAEDDTSSILREAWAERGGHKIGGILHCFTGTQRLADAAVEMGFLISFSGVLTFKNAEELRAVAQSLPLEKILIETDCPYLAPVPHRGQRNEPAYVVETAAKIAELHQLTVEDVARMTSYNFRHLFNLREPLPAGNNNERNIVYQIRDALYINLTNRCTSLCVFCDRIDNPIASGYNLGLAPEEEPSAAEVITAIGDPTRYREIVFCGYGEPTIRLEELKEVARYCKARGTYVRVNTIGHANLYHGRNVVPELVGVVDELSISLNAPTREQYERIVRSDWPDRAFDSMQAFARDAAARGIKVTLSVVEIPNLDLEACRRMAESIGAEFRPRKLMGMVGNADFRE